MFYECPRCGYGTERSTDFFKHLNRRIVCDALNSDLSIEDIKTDFMNRKSNDFICNFCNKPYSSRKSLANHKIICKANKNVDNKSIQEEKSQNTSNNPDVNLYQEILNLKKEIDFLKFKKYCGTLNVKKIYENEKFYQILLEKYLNGTHKTISCGITDITTDTCHAEIKLWTRWKDAVGQVTCYNTADPKENLSIYFFGDYKESSKNEAIDIIKKCNIHPYEFVYSSGRIDLIDLVNKKIIYSQNIEV